MSKHLFILLILLIISFSSRAFETSQTTKIFSELPEQINPADKFVFYSHGLIVEGNNPKPEHPNWGVYDFPAVVKALSDPKYNLIAYHRPKNTDPREYAKKLNEQVTYLIEKGVPARNISLVGFSRGGFITVLASNELKNTALNFAIIAACTTNFSLRKDISIYGHIYSIFETTDSVGSCGNLTKNNVKTVTSFQEISITTGKDHGAFYRPIDAWVKPLKSWLTYIEQR